ncbi:hypothetical protein HA402_011636 [Bradysia odoriphaga]|nr:hypothetical protein HA402_011636 [Bradysia odoriphaga]
MATDKIKVAVRVRPFNRRELELSTQCIVEMEGQQTILRNPSSMDKITDRCAYHMHIWGLTDNPGCDCGALNQTMLHIATECPTRAFSNSIADVHEVTIGAREWLNRLDLQL